jgi:hypothetical protein
VDLAQLELAHIIEAGKGTGDLNARLKGPLGGVFDYIQKEPIKAAREFDPKAVGGNVDMRINLAFPTHENVRMQDIQIQASGQAQDIVLPDVVGALDVTGGPMQIVLKDGLLNIQGQANVEGQPADILHKEYLDSAGKDYAAQTKVSVIVNDAIRTTLNLGLEDYISGPAPTTVTYTVAANGTGSAEFQSDLTPATLYAPPFGYEKKPDIPASARAQGVFKNDLLQSIKSLEITGPALQVKNASLEFSGDLQTRLKTLKFPALVVGETVGDLDLSVSPQGKYTITMSGALLDFRPFLLPTKPSSETGKSSPPMDISMTFDRMRTSESAHLQQVKIFASLDPQQRFLQLELDAIAGTGDIYLRFKPDETGKRFFRLEAQDAGATLRAFDMYDKIQGGTLLIQGEPAHALDDDNLVGVAQINDFRVVGAPTLARLLSALSLPGMMGLLDDQGLSFKKLEANYDWLYRPEGSLLILDDGRTSGNEVGLTFDGTYDRAEGSMDISGTIVPLSTINKMIGSIPLLGDILTGGTGSLIAATYTIKGPAQAPDVSVNPLSVLTPGLLRRILFE